MMKAIPVSAVLTVPALAAVLWGASLSFAAAPAQPMPSPEALYNQATRSAQPKGAYTGEQFCWNAGYYMGNFLTGYEAYKDTAWLDWGVKYYDWCVAKQGAGPDGYKGWVGPDSGTGNTWNDRHVGQAVLLDKMLDFSELVLKDLELMKKYGTPAQAYVDIARKDCMEKWDKRGTWREDGEFGAYVDWGHYCEANTPTVWKERPGEGISLPFNKQNDMALVALKLYRITGEKALLEKARKMYAFMRSRFQYVADKDYYVWNYWEPFGPWDVDLAKKTTRHWMNVHGYRNYQAGEIGQIVEAYHTGIVFTPLDMERIINTNLKVMWNGDKAAPKWVNSNALLPSPVLTPEERKKQEEEANSNPYAREGRAGTLWTALNGLSQGVRDLEAARMGGGGRDSQVSIGRAYFQNVTMKTPVGFDRKYAKDAKPGGSLTGVEQVPVTSCKSLTVATVMPHILGDRPSVVLCKSRIDNDLEVAVYSADGKDKKCVLHKGKITGGTDGLVGIFILTWDGADPATKTKLPKGNYLMRWTVADGTREFPVVIP